MNPSEPVKKDYRAAIENELRQRLAEDRAPAVAVRLLCLQCRGLSTSDARFCKHCGARFNALVVAEPAAPARERRA